MNDDAIYARLAAVFRAVFPDEEATIGPQTSEADMPFADSVKMVELILEVESQFRVRVRARDVEALRTPRDWVELIRAQTP